MPPKASEIKQFEAWVTSLSTSQERAEAICKMIATACPASIEIALPHINLVENIDDIVWSLVEAAPASIDPVLRHLVHFPLSKSGQACALALGEIGFKQESARDVRITTTLIQAVRAGLKTAVTTDKGRRIRARSGMENQVDEWRTGTAAVSASVAAILSCARASPVPEATPAMLGVLKTARRERDPYLWTVTNALEILYLSDPVSLLSEASSIREQLPNEHPLVQRIEWFLKQKRL